MSKSFLLLFLSVFLFMAGNLKAQNKAEGNSIDRIVAVVNKHIILKSDIDKQVRQYIYQEQQRQNKSVPFKKKIWYSVLQNMVQNFVLYDQAQVDSVTVSDSRVDQQISRRINNAVEQLGSKSALEKQMGENIIKIRDGMKKQFRKQLTIQKFRQQKLQDVNITRPEVEEYFHSIPDDSIPTIPEKVALSQIVAVPTPKDSARIKAKHLAEELRDSIINHGKSIEELARKYSDGPSASDGGHIPMYPIDQLAAPYAAAAAALKPGEISQVVKTSFGYHVIRLNKRQGDKIDTNHILIAVDKNSYNKKAAIKKLNQIRDSLKTSDKKTFEQFARQQSEDPNTADRGGRILNPNSGARLLTINQLDPALYRIVLLLKNPGDISTPKPFTIGKTNKNEKKAFRIVRLDKHNAEHTANLKDDYEAIKRTALQKKKFEVMNAWIADLKKEVYIEYKIPMPDEYTAQK